LAPNNQPAPRGEIAHESISSGSDQTRSQNAPKIEKYLEYLMGNFNQCKNCKLKKTRNPAELPEFLLFISLFVSFNRVQSTENSHILNDSNRSVLVCYIYPY